ncbi:MAG: hypothetical protein ACRCSN_00730, partial [Dermatophilaceae bacterium]
MTEQPPDENREHSRDHLDELRVSTVAPSPVADLVGRVLSPIPVLVALIGWTATVATTTVADAARWAALAGSLVVGVPFVALILLRVSGRVTDRQVVHRSQRHLLFAIALLASGAAAASLWLLDAPRALTVLVSIMAILLAVMTTLTRWKPSMHLAVATGAVVALTELHGPHALAFGCLLPLIAWA